ncbi:hypothetical protein KXQ82_13695 [Mucilaginibacter sp. HMF5004]|uniref:hypothetical protein n=1 Tax=Mucilaginibacter rivuli TaxID=2857527 RepID=UPI001C604858|nr:hypothetical protein [Mucilaginibacter rivuli]MBW4890779.1 hypothetical protein [Mucilaginibacter rivuli]
MEANKENPETFKSPDEFNQADSEQVEQPERHEYKQADSEQVEQPERHEFEEEGTGEAGGYQQDTEVENPSQNDNPSTEHTTLHNREVDFQPSNHGRSTGRMVGHEPGIDNAV